MRYKIEWQAGGELTIDTGGTDWTPEELESQVDQAINEAVDRVAEAVADEFDECEVDQDESVYEVKTRRLS